MSPLDRVAPALPPTATPRPARGEDPALRDAARQLESVFVEQLFKAMRATVPQEDGIVTASTGEEIFTGLLDQHLAAETPAQWSGGVAEALYRQLRPRTVPAVADGADAQPLDR